MRGKSWRSSLAEVNLAAVNVYVAFGPFDDAAGIESMGFLHHGLDVPRAQVENVADPPPCADALFVDGPGSEADLVGTHVYCRALNIDPLGGHQLDLAV